MYNKFFGFKERPFQLLPNPEYLFLARSHEEAMAHLKYAISQGDGFVEITGEVGTGKTTLCRAFLESLDEDTEYAYIFNPKMNSVQLLKAINDEFGIPSDADNIKDLIDVLNKFLIEKKSQSKKVIILIDEAQNLSKDVLEQIRLLSNLETSTSKLLQIILVGQPELGEMLDSYELRQLGQRISLSCHLQPLTFKETKDYINHRLHIASPNPDVTFTGGAFREIYDYSRGIPRMINIVCDRALLSAFGLNKKRITRTIVKSAIKELSTRGEIKKAWLRKRVKRFAYVFIVVAVVMSVYLIYRAGYFNKIQISGTDRSTISIKEKGKNVSPEHSSKNRTPKGRVKEEKEISQKANPSVLTFSQLMEETGAGLTRSSALKWALNLWGQGYSSDRYMDSLDDDNFFRFVSKRNGFEMKKLNDHDFNIIKILNIPAILKFTSPGSDEPKYMVLKAIRNGDMVLLDDKGKEIIGTLEEIKQFYSGVAYVPWKNFLNFPGTIPVSAPRESLIILKMLLKELGFENIKIDPVYDDATREAIEIIQAKHGLKVDGIVGPLTKIVLYNESGSLKIPHLFGGNNFKEKSDEREQGKR